MAYGGGRLWINNQRRSYGEYYGQEFEGGDVDGDGTAEIVTGGFAYDGEKVNAQLRIWNWNAILYLEKSHEWITEDITEIKAISLNDVDGDEQMDIVTSGDNGSLWRL